MDTPGVHKPGSQLDRRMLQEVHDALETRDLVLVLVDASRRHGIGTRGEGQGAGTNRPEQGTEVQPPAPEVQAQKDKRQRDKAWASEDEFLFSLVRKLDCPVFLVLTKIDLVPKEQLLPMIEALRQQHEFAEVFPVSARKKDGLDVLLRRIVDALPTGERYFPKDQYTDQPLRFMVAELIRERILVETGEEVPYSAAVVIERFEEPAA